MEKKWGNITQGLRFAVGLRFAAADAPADLPGFQKYEAPPDAPFRNFYWLIGGEEPKRISLGVPPEGLRCSYCELRFRRRAHHRVIFGRSGEVNPFGFAAENYVRLRINPEERTNDPYKYFNPLFIRIDKEEVTRFFLLKARWARGRITITIKEIDGSASIPDFLVNLPKHLEVAENAYLLLD